MLKANIAILVAGSFVLGGTGLVQAQTPDTPTAQAPAAPPAAPAAKSPLTQWGTDFSFLFDGYTDKNFNSPPSGYNGLRNFDVRADTLHVNMGKITIDHGPAPVGFHLDVGFGQTFDIIHSANRDPSAWKYFEQAYVSLKPKSWKGVEIDAGQFVTSAGAEVIETNQNWNYSRSLLFAWAIPYYHFGFRASIPVGHFTGGIQVVNGWNNIEPLNSGKTVGLNAAYAWKKVTWTNNYYVGPEKVRTTKGLRNLFDTVVQVNQNDNFSYYFNFDYGRDKNIGPGASQWVGIAGAARYAIPKTKFALATRLEWFDDKDGFSTGTAQQVKEFTLTGEYKFTGWLMSRFEFRNDWSDQAFFETQSPAGSKNQPTVLFGLIAYLAPKK
jgi:hypothetical protein